MGYGSQKSTLRYKLRNFVHTILERSGVDRLIKIEQWNRSLEKLRQGFRPILRDGPAHDFMARLIQEGKPAALGKIGDIECAALAWHLGLRRLYKYHYLAPTYGQLALKEQTGVFPKTEEVYHRFCDLFLERLRQFDVFFLWFNPGEGVIAKKYCPKPTYIELTGLEPYYHPMAPWSAQLAGKTVLVVHPFAETIEEQYRRREQIWRSCPEVLPQFRLLTVKSPYGFSKNTYPDWFEMLRWLESQVSAVAENEGFDVALIGCGAAGPPLAAYVKTLGKIGIHLGGPTQILFGIKGKRWDRNPFFSKFYNEAWTRPRTEETPPESETVDRGGYW